MLNKSRRPIVRTRQLGQRRRDSTFDWSQRKSSPRQKRLMNSKAGAYHGQRQKIHEVEVNMKTSSCHRRMCRRLQSNLTKNIGIAIFLHRMTKNLGTRLMWG